MNREPFWVKCVGRWKSILPAIGVDARFLTGKNCPCPMCGGKDRFRFDNKEGRGTFFCSHCGAGDGLTFAMMKMGLDFKGMVERVEPLIGAAKVEQKRNERSDADKRAAMNEVWKSSWPVKALDPVGLYLARRCGLTAFPACLRYAERLKYFDDTTRSFPAMVAMMSDKDGKPAILHRTFLTEDGKKAPVESPRRIMPGYVPKGGAIRLGPPAEVMGVAEGIETALSAAIMFNMPVWATTGTSGLTSWVPPPEAKQVYIFGDKDRKYAGQATAYALAHRLACSGFDWENVRVSLPSEFGTDWNDEHQVRLGKVVEFA